MPGASPRHRENATFVMLARNGDVEGAVNAVREMEDRFNGKFNYPWVFLNDVPFSDEFKRCVVGLLSECVCTSDTHRSRVSNLVSGPAHFGQVPEEHWHQPPWINETKATEERSKMIMAGIPYSDSISCGLPLFLSCTGDISDIGSYASRYRNMCRFNSGVRSNPLSFSSHVSVLTKPA